MERRGRGSDDDGVDVFTDGGISTGAVGLKGVRLLVKGGRHVG